MQRASKAPLPQVQRLLTGQNWSWHSTNLVNARGGKKKSLWNVTSISMVWWGSEKFCSRRVSNIHLSFPQESWKYNFSKRHWTCCPKMTQRWRWPRIHEPCYWCSYPIHVFPSCQHQLTDQTSPVTYSEWPRRNHLRRLDLSNEL